MIMIMHISSKNRKEVPSLAYVEIIEMKKKKRKEKKTLNGYENLQLKHGNQNSGLTCHFSFKHK